MDERIGREIARRAGMDPLDKELQKVVFLSKHTNECPKCQAIVDLVEEIIEIHAKEDWK